MKKKNDTRRYRYSLHGDIKIDTRSNAQALPATGYTAIAVQNGGRVFSTHKDGSISWVCDTVMLSTAEAMVEDLSTSLGGQEHQPSSPLLG